MRPLKTLWQFSRPHTIIGSFFSISSLYLITLAIVYPHPDWITIREHLPLFALTLASALCCNIYIVGLNQLEDIEIDRINKPWLPIPAGNLTVSQAKMIIAISGLLSLVFAFLENQALFFLILVILGIGTAYSIPPLKFKRHHIAAAISILLVRGILVNIGMPVQFYYALKGTFMIPPDVWPLTFFVVGFSLAIAWFKDIPDTQGDSKFEIKTLAISLSPKVALRYGVAVVAVSYVGLLLLTAMLELDINQHFFFISHSALLLFFLYGAGKIRIDNPVMLKKFYMIFWVFFFAEYLVYTLAYYI